MKEILMSLNEDLAKLKRERDQFNTNPIHLEHKSPEQTRAMVIDMLFNQSENTLEATIRQLTILAQHYY